MNQDRKNKHVAAGDHQRLHAGSHGIAQQLAEAAAVLLAGTLHIAERLAKPGRAAPAAAVRSGRFRGVPGRGTIPPKNMQRDPGGQSGGPVHGEQKQAEFGAAEKPAPMTITSSIGLQKWAAPAIRSASFAEILPCLNKVAPYRRRPESGGHAKRQHPAEGAGKTEQPARKRFKQRADAMGESPARSICDNITNGSKAGKTMCHQIESPCPEALNASPGAYTTQTTSRTASSPVKAVEARLPAKLFKFIRIHLLHK